MENNKNMNPVFSLKNFRSFGEDGADFELAPITVLTGCNSAGKSSLVKALMLLSSGSEGGRYMETLKLSSKDLCLGGYKNVAHKDGHIIMSYTIWSAELQDTLVVTRKYCAQRNDELNDGDLVYLTVEKSDGTLIYKGGDQYSENKQHDDAIKEEFNRFYAVGCYMRVMELLSLLEKKKRKSFDDESSQIKRIEEAVKIVKEKLKSVGVDESDAALLWKEFDHNAFYTVIKAMDPLGRGDTVTLSDCIKTPDEEEIEFMLREFIDHIVDDVRTPFFTKQPIYINSASAQIERLYTVSDDNKMCRALRELNRRKIQYDKECVIGVDPTYCIIHKPGSFLDRWLDMFKIGKSIEVRGTDQGLGLMAYLINYKKEERLLADEGYGITQLVALLLQIDNCIPVFLGCDEDTFIKEHKMVYNYEPKTICVEEPEVHLHPKYQSLLAEMFVEAYQKYNIHFIIETHSEYLIRKLQVMVADKENALSPNDVSLNYVEKDESGASTNRQIKIEEDGSLSDSFGAGFYDEADTLAIQLFRNKPILS